MTEGFSCVISAVFAFFLTGLVRYYLLEKQVLDIPNARSSHSQPIPKGGGLGLIAGFLGAVSAECIFGHGFSSQILYLLGLSLCIALLGFWDDLYDLSKKMRLLFQFVVAAGGIALLDIYALLPVENDFYRWIFCFFCLFYLVWFLNLFNFMDGINGLAAVEAITLLLGGALLSFLVLGNSDWLFMLIFVAALFGFLVWNFPCAKVFMGDAGSCFLGLLLGFISLWQGIQDERLFVAWLIMSAVFIVDATVTLLTRIILGQPFYEAHCSHAYQFATRKLGSHTRVTLAVAVINLCYLFPLAISVVFLGFNLVNGLFVAYLPLILLVIYFRAGNESWQNVI